MSLIRLYIPDIIKKDQPITLPAEQSHYVTNVMRLKTDDQLYVFNEASGQWQARITLAHKKHCQILPTTLVRATRSAKSPDLWLCFAPVKQTPLTNIIQKSTELGVSRLCPIKTQHTSNFHLNIERINKIAIESAEQSERLSIPSISTLTSIDNLLINWDSTRILFFADESLNGRNIEDCLADFRPPLSAAFLIGPEGGFSEDERKLLRAQSFVRPVTLGPRILRADTACIAALACYMSKLGDWK